MLADSFNRKMTRREISSKDKVVKSIKIANPKYEKCSLGLELFLDPRFLILGTGHGKFYPYEKGVRKKL